MNINVDSINAEFTKSSSAYSECPEEQIPEFAFIGRSNVGKSSLINYLTGRKNIAKTSSTPGKTQLINHFKINESLFFVDLPGYGYAKVSKDKKQVFQKLITEYLENSKMLYCVFVLLDSRLTPQKIDIEFLEYLGVKKIPFVIVFTKTDKISKVAIKKQVEAYQDELLKTWEFLPQIFKTSSSKKIGKIELLEFINENIA